MSLPYVYKTVESGDIADTKEWSDQFKADQNYTIEKVFIMRKDGQAFTKSTITFWLENQPLTKDVVPCALFPPSEFDSPALGYEIKANQVFKWTLKNLEGTTISVFLVLKLKPK